MTQKQDAKQKRIIERIIEVLRKSPEPLRESELAKRIGTGRNVIHYHLKKLTESGIVTSKEKRYSLDEKSTVVEAIVKILVEKECNFIELQNLGFDKRHIQNALSALEGERRICKKYPNVITNESRDVRYALAPFAYSELGVCPICKKKIAPSEEVITTTFMMPSDEFKSRTVSIHVKCYPNCKSGREFCCDHCGLPISPKLLDRQQIDHHSISDHFYKIELDMIDFLWRLKEMLSPHVNISNSRLSDFENRMEWNIKIKKYYTDYPKQYNIGDIPKWILESMKTEEKREARNLELDSKIANSTGIASKIADSKASKELQEQVLNALKSGESSEAIKRHFSEFDSKTGMPERIEELNKLVQERYDPAFEESTSREIRHELEAILPPSDLSYLNYAEEFITGIMKYREKLPEDYDIKSRIKEIWLDAKKLRQENERTILSMYEKLLGPSGFLYTHTSPTWAVAPDEYKWFYDDLTAERPRRWSLIEYDLFHSTTLAYRHDGKTYHPYCAEKLGLTNTSYCINNNNKKLKGGDINEQDF
jgi:DNA-binding Lrp family transcriptional regulator